MIEADLILEFEIEDGKSPDLENVARTLLAWNDAVQAAARAIDPSAEIVVELVGVEAGSQRFRQIFRHIDNFADNVEEGGKEYPHIWKHSKALAKCIAGGILLAGVTHAVTPDDQTPVLRDIRDLLRKDIETRQASQIFYESAQHEPSFSKIDVYESDYASEPVYSVPRSEFAHRSGLFDPQGDEAETVTTRPRTVTWEVVLVRPVLVGKARRWTFAREGIEFSALMTDKAVLQALHDRTLSIPFAEGVMMQIEVGYRERQEGLVWLPVRNSLEVTRVLSPRPPLSPTPLFPGADRP